MSDPIVVLIEIVTEPKFTLGMMLITPNAKSDLSGDDVFDAMCRHVRCDWGDLDPEDKQRNNEALTEGARLFSEYHSSSGTKFWIITEADRSATTVLLPEDY